MPSGIGLSGLKTVAGQVMRQALAANVIPNIFASAREYSKKDYYDYRYFPLWDEYIVCV
jgi:hypothetical protein